MITFTIEIKGKHIKGKIVLHILLSFSLNKSKYFLSFFFSLWKKLFKLANVKGKGYLHGQLHFLKLFIVELHLLAKCQTFRVKEEDQLNFMIVFKETNKR